MQAATGAATTATVRLAMADAAQATQAMRALHADNGDHLACRAEGATLVLEASGPAVLSVLRTLEDAFDGLRAAGLLR